MFWLLLSTNNCFIAIWLRLSIIVSLNSYGILSNISNPNNTLISDWTINLVTKSFIKLGQSSNNFQIAIMAAP
jgi:hypothetical protein